MDTKLKSLSKNPFVRGLLIVLCAALVTASIFAFAAFSIAENELDMTLEELLTASRYSESDALARDFRNKAQMALELMKEYKSEDHIRAGGTLTDWELENAKEELFYEYYHEGLLFGGSREDDTVRNYPATGIATEAAETEAEASGDSAYYWEMSYSDPSVRKAFEEYYADEIKQLENRIIQQDLYHYQQINKLLDASNGFQYYITDGAEVYTNMAGLGDMGRQQINSRFSEFPAYVIFEDNGYTAYPQTLEDQSYQSNRLRYLFEDYYLDSGFRAYMAFHDEYINTKNQVFSNVKDEIIFVTVVSLVCAAAAFIVLAFLIVTAGWRREDGTLELRGMGRWFTEMQIFLLCLLPVLGIIIVSEISYSNYTSWSYYDSYYDSMHFESWHNNYSILQWALMAAVCLAGMFFFLHALLAFVEKLKAKRLLKDSVIFRFCRRVSYGVREVYSAGTAMAKVTTAVILVCLLSATIVLSPVAAVAAIFFIARYLRQYEEIKKGVKEVKSGNLSYQIPELGRGNGELAELATDINEISQGFDLAVKQELKNQRLKTDLISNVSHDIKTPLTSIITYVDLLKKEGADSENREKYLDILTQKSQRLKKLTEDLFEAAKASSGDIPVHFEKVDLLSLVNQGLGEMNDHLLQRGLEVILKAQQEKYYVNADGQLLWRVVENLLGNVIKYAQKNSRVYIDLYQQDSQTNDRIEAVLEMKNISENPLNIPAEELMERFKRGDEARTTEGSGLGLAIAKDLTAMQNGTFDIVVDGDLFKVIVALESVQDIKNE